MAADRAIDWPRSPRPSFAVIPLSNLASLPEGVSSLTTKDLNNHEGILAQSSGGDRAAYLLDDGEWKALPIPDINFTWTHQTYPFIYQSGEFSGWSKLDDNGSVYGSLEFLRQGDPEGKDDEFWDSAPPDTMSKIVRASLPDLAIEVLGKTDDLDYSSGMVVGGNGVIWEADGEEITSAAEQFFDSVEILGGPTPLTTRRVIAARSALYVQKTSDGPWFKSHPDDWALAAGIWQINQKLKPATGYFYDVTPLSGKNHFYHQPFLALLRELSFPDDRYEVFSYAAESRSFATGAEGNTAGVFDVTESVNVRAKFGFEREHKGHSAQFRSTIQKRWAYWTQTLDDMEIGPE